MGRERLRDIYRVFQPSEALAPDDPRYVECGREQGSGELKDILSRTILLSTNPTCQLLSGYRGCGKTTELNRVRQELSQASPRYFVVHCQTDAYVDLLDVDATEVLLALLQELWKSAAEQGIRLQSDWLHHFLEADDVRRVLKPQGELKTAEMGFPFLIQALKGNPHDRYLIRQSLAGRTAGFVQAVNEVVRQTQNALQAKGYQGLAIMLDNLDRVPRYGKTADRNSQESLFLDGGPLLRQVECHLIITIPPTLLFSLAGGILSGLFDTPPRILSPIVVMDRSGEVYVPGVRKLMEIIDRRLSTVGASVQQTFESEEVLRRLCLASGGQLRVLMNLVQAAIIQLNDLPITAPAVKQAIRNQRDSFVRAIPKAWWPLLRQVAATRDIERTDTALAMLNGLAVLEYRDIQGQWFAVNPVLRETPELKTAK